MAAQENAMPLDHRIRSRGLRRWDSWTECLGIFAFFKKFKRVAATATPRDEFRGGAHRARVQNANIGSLDRTGNAHPDALANMGR
jgi:hypothetical protein